MFILDTFIGLTNKSEKHCRDLGLISLLGILIDIDFLPRVAVRVCIHVKGKHIVG